jgi:hypothetical protein
LQFFKKREVHFVESKERDMHFAAKISSRGILTEEVKKLNTVASNKHRRRVFESGTISTKGLHISRKAIQSIDFS